MLIHMHVHSTYILSHCITHESHLEFIISTLCSKEANTSSSSLSHNDAPNSWEFTCSPCAQPHARPTQQISFLTTLHRRIIWSYSQLSVRRRPSLRSNSISDRNHTPNSWALSQVDSISSVSSRMSHADVIINTPSQLGRHSPSGQVSHKSTRSLSWL
jgi:hypothetical protein